MRRPGQSVLANPVLVGAVTLLVVNVAVFLAYNANNGLPFVPTTTLHVQLPSGANVVKGNEVRTGGFRVGIVTDVNPVPIGNGDTGADLTLKLDKSVGAIPTDTRAQVRNRSALGLKYIDLQLGRAKQDFASGDTVPARHTKVPVELDDLFGVFDEPTRAAEQVNLVGFGNALSFRGPDLGRTIEELPRLFLHLEPVARTLADPETDLRGFIQSLADTAGALAPVSKEQAHLFTTMADTFAAIDRDPERLKQFIEKGPSTLDVSTDSLRVQRPFLHDFADFSEDFAVATHELRGALPDLNAAIDRGIPVQRDFVDTNRRLGRAFAALDDLASSPTTPLALRGLTATVDTLNPTIKFLGPYQTVCNYWNYFWTQVAEHFSEPDITGHSQRALLNSAGHQDDAFGSMGANGPANGQGVIDGNAQFLHGPGYGAAITNGGAADCEVGQRGFLYRDAANVKPQYHVHVDANSPGAQGPTFKGRPSVPKGETFTRRPETGPGKDLYQSEFGP
ncbi:MAG: phospholipid/cholesterol/gamma-HCH transport system substrate-binding protein [Solirubrobacteraceae bacterium]|jgi:virulence factor Mce-like protein|nr:phospholipid/cholesterol/gamma-HCH transport system substrate-binding protein [Solirubrobacteraceae bacterium]